MAEQIAVFGGAFDPFHLGHLEVTRRLLEQFDRVVVVPCGSRPDKASTDDVLPVHRAAMIDLSLRALKAEAPDRLAVEYFDLELATFTRTRELEARFANLGKVWHVIGTDWVVGGKSGESRIHTVWEEGPRLWQDLNFAVVARPGFVVSAEGLPPKREVIDLSNPIEGREIRTRAFNHEPLDGLVSPAVAEYIKRHELFSGRPARVRTAARLGDLRLLLVADPCNPQALAEADKLSRFEDRDSPELIVVLGGDGTMLRAARELWPMRAPFFGINFGHIGHNLNDVREGFDPEQLRQELEVWQCPLLYVEAIRPDGSTRRGFAFNDAWVSADSRVGKGARFSVTVDGEAVLPEVSGDGVLVATAQGSTAYAKAMGGRPLRVDTPELLLVGNNIFQPAGWKQASLSMRSEVVVTSFSQLDASGVRFRPLFGVVDGVPFGEVVEMRVRASSHAAVELAFFAGHDFAAKLAREQFPGRRR